MVLGQVERAKKWLVRAVEIDPNDPVVQYNVACNLAVLGEIDKAIDYLEEAIGIGTISADWMRNDEDLVNLRGNPRFEALMQKLGSEED